MTRIADVAALLLLLICVCSIRSTSAAWNGIPLGTTPKAGVSGSRQNSPEADEALVSQSRAPNSASRKEREQLYEAYNHLHTLAQDFHKPFDAPAVIVVGHQTSGKSALIEALMGFQFNQVCMTFMSPHLHPSCLRTTPRAHTRPTNQPSLFRFPPRRSAEAPRRVVPWPCACSTTPVAHLPCAF